MLNRYCKDEFNEDHLATLGIEFAMRKYKTKADGTDVTVKVWDTAGQERFRTITQTFYRRADGVIIAFDLSELESFNQIETWVESVAKHANTNIIKILVGNKCDMPEDQRQVTFQ